MDSPAIGGEKSIHICEKYWIQEQFTPSQSTWCNAVVLV